MPLQGLSSAEALVELLAAEGVDRHRQIRVTGPSALHALLWLSRHGFEQVGYVRPGEVAPGEAPEAVIVAHTCAASGLERVLPLARRLTSNGVLIFQAAADAQVEALLTSAGFEVTRCLHGGRRDAFVARRRALALSKAA